MNRRQERGQSTLEYAFLLAIIISAIITVQVYVRRGLVGQVHDTADQQIGSQFDPWNTTGKVQHTSGGGTEDVVTNDGKTVSTLTALTNKDEYVQPEVVTPYAPSDTLFQGP